MEGEYNNVAIRGMDFDDQEDQNKIIQRNSYKTQNIAQSWEVPKTNFLRPFSFRMSVLHPSMENTGLDF